MMMTMPTKVMGMAQTIALGKAKARQLAVPQWCHASEGCG